MDNRQEVVKRIKYTAKEKKISVTQMLIDCEMGKNTITKFANGTNISIQNFVKIADYLNCSVDYLLGRQDYPALNSTITIIDQLNDEGIKKAVDYITDLLDNPKYKKKQNVNDEPIRAIGLDNTLKAAAYEGKGIIDDTLKHT